MERKTELITDKDGNAVYVLKNYGTSHEPTKNELCQILGKYEDTFESDNLAVITRCKNCVKYYEYDEFDRDTNEMVKCHTCKVFDRDFGETFHCGFGERKKKK